MTRAVLSLGPCSGPGRAPQCPPGPEESPPLFVSSPCCLAAFQATVAAAVAAGVAVATRRRQPRPRSGPAGASDGSARSASRPCTRPVSGRGGREASGLGPASFPLGRSGGPPREGATLLHRSGARGNSGKEGWNGFVSFLEILISSRGERKFNVDDVCRRFGWTCEVYKNVYHGTLVYFFLITGKGLQEMYFVGWKEINVFLKL